MRRRVLVHRDNFTEDYGPGMKSVQVMKRLYDLDIVIENPKGSIRSGPWGEAELKADYGYFARTVGADGEGIDVFIGPDLESTAVWVLYQLDPLTSKFDEHKVMLCYSSLINAISDYVGSYNDGYEDNMGYRRIGRARWFNIDQFKRWLDQHRIP